MFKFSLLLCSFLFIKKNNIMINIMNIGQIIFNIPKFITKNTTNVINNKRIIVNRKYLYFFFNMIYN